MTAWLPHDRRTGSGNTHYIISFAQGWAISQPGRNAATRCIPRIHPPNLTEAEIWASWSHANLPLPTLPKSLPIWSLWEISLETKRPLPRFALRTDFAQESRERIFQIVMPKKGRFHSSFIKFVQADYFLQMTKANSMNLIRATFNTATEVHKFNLNQGWVFSANSTYSAPSMLP